MQEKVSEYKAEASGDVEGNKAHVFQIFLARSRVKPRNVCMRIWWIPLWCSVIRLIHQCWKATKTMRKVERIMWWGRWVCFYVTVRQPREITKIFE
ncbi:unnamed protein product [Brassica oleracea]